MKNIFLDVNIIIDYILDRKIEETNIIQLLKSPQEYNLFTSALTAHIVMYVLKPKRGSYIFKQINLIFQTINIIPLTQRTIEKSLETDFNDFEDLLQYFSAQIFCDTIFTRDTKHFQEINSLTKGKMKIISKYE